MNWSTGIVGLGFVGGKKKGIWLEETKAEMPSSTQVWGRNRIWLADLCSRKSASVKRAE